MRVGTLEIDFRIPGSDSLKAKRRVVASLRDRIRSRFPVAVAEVEDQEMRARAVLGVATVSGNGAIIERTLDEVVRLVESDMRIVVVDVVRDTF